MHGEPGLGPRAKQMQDLRRLSGRRRTRLDRGLFVIDGPTLVAEALASPIEIRVVYAEPDAPDDVLDAAAQRGVPVQSVTAGTLAKVTDPVTPQPVAAVGAIPAHRPVPYTGLAFVLVDVGDPGNTGTLVRAAEACAASAVVCCGDGVDPWSPKCVRAAAGSAFRVPVRVVPTFADAVSELRAAGMELVATAVRGGEPLDDADLTGDVAVVLGSEAHGLSPEALAAVDRSVTVPMAGQVESLNVAMCGAIVGFEAARQRRTRRSGP